MNLSLPLPFLDPAALARAGEGVVPSPAHPLMTTRFATPWGAGAVVSRGFDWGVRGARAVAFRVDLAAGSLGYFTFRFPAAPPSGGLLGGPLGGVESGPVWPASWGWAQGVLRVDFFRTDPWAFRAGQSSAALFVWAAGVLEQEIVTVDGAAPAGGETPVVYSIRGLPGIRPPITPGVAEHGNNTTRETVR